MSSSSRGLGLQRQQEYKVTGRYYGSEELVMLLYPSEDGEHKREEHPLKQSLISRLSIAEKEFLVRDKKIDKRIAPESLEEKLKSGSYECCVAQIEKENLPLFIGYRLYRKSSTLAMGVNEDSDKTEKAHDGSTLIIVDTGVVSIKDEKENQNVISLLRDTPKKNNGILEKNLSLTLPLPTKDSLSELALHVRSNTSFWYGGFFGNRKEAELKQIADEIKQKNKINEVEVKNYLLKIAHAAMHTRGTPRRRNDGSGLLPTNSGQAFMNAVFSQGGKFTSLGKWLDDIKAKQQTSLPSGVEEVKDAKEKKEREKKEKEEKFYALYGAITLAAGLKLNKTPGCCFSSEKVESDPTKLVLDPARPYRRTAKS